MVNAVRGYMHVNANRPNSPTSPHAIVVSENRSVIFVEQLHVVAHLGRSGLSRASMTSMQLDKTATRH